MAYVILIRHSVSHDMFGNFHYYLKATTEYVLNERVPMHKICVLSNDIFDSSNQQLPTHIFYNFFPDPPNVTITAESSIMGIISKDKTIVHLNLTHFFVFLFCGIIILISVFLGAQYVFRYHRYQLAKSKEEAESPLNTPRGSTASISQNPANGNLRATSTSTLMSEVVTLVKLKPKKSSIKHQKLRESVVSQDFEKDQLNDCDSIGNYSK